ncbi:Fur family transcriptional regulator [Maricaulis salignorans]|uniref:Fur family transcriptional regulator, zinc uptake regulator n=1 Tax=Maricaulis salignorans TaxID=144026 RepID=A0A1G9P7N4_9PROT|nr:Fur family transcriptional regulator [Maricaulis salignorans]SDL94759.1 Fur family transcriptional regulator, zinc uptake regulator [Maricaulis salignorans]
MNEMVDLAEARCREQGLELTPLRRRTLEALIRAGRPLKAYDLMEELSGHGGRNYPYSIYRTLEFLQAIGLARRVERLNAYMLWGDHDRCGPVSLFICERCSGVETRPLDVAVHQPPSGFRITHTVSEYYGACATCGASMS